MKVFPLFSLADLPFYLQMLPALVVGFFFGFVLEGSGFGNARVLAAQFYGNNMRVFKVMFTSIITAGVGMALLSGAGVLDMTLLAFPETYIWPHLVGGLLLGAGFIISGYCPGTSIVAAGSGKLDGFITVFGVVIGSVAFGELYPWIKDFYLSSGKGVMTLDGLLGVPYALAMAALAIAAIGMFIGAEKLEQVLGRRMKKSERPRTRYARGPLYALAGVGVVAAVLAYLPVSGRQAVGEHRQVAKMSPTELGTLIIERPGSLYVVDMRKKPDCEGKDRLPLALCYEDIRENIKDFFPGRRMVVYGYGPLKKVPDRVKAFPGDIYRLEGGLAGWKSSIIEDPQKRRDEIVKKGGSETYSLVLALHSYFTGAEVAAAPPQVPKVIKRTKKKGGGGCI